VEYCIKDIEAMSYTDFVATVHQWNVPPGSLSTINEWAIFGRVTNKSKVLEVACTTGFSGRELAKLTGCSVYGVDISKLSVESARTAAKIYAPNYDLRYDCIDIYDIMKKNKYTHIILGAAIQFFANKGQLMDKLLNLLDDDGKILVSPYYLKDGELPSDIITAAERVIGITPTNFGYDTAMAYYNRFEILYQSRKDIIPETASQMQQYATDTVDRCCEIEGIVDVALKAALYRRLLEIKVVCNRIHEYHAFSVMVLRYRRNIYPNRFVELF
jgi:2-polyprenyl-3-methyl-5-hydroxy-6-metoxy-1,4-benzoquinol methylase